MKTPLKIWIFSKEQCLLISKTIFGVNGELFHLPDDIFGTDFPAVTLGGDFRIIVDGDLTYRVPPFFVRAVFLDEESERAGIGCGQA